MERKNPMRRWLLVLIAGCAWLSHGLADDTAPAASRHANPHVLHRQHIGAIAFAAYGGGLSRSGPTGDGDVIGLRIESGVSGTARRKINDVLKKKFDDAVAQWLDCSDENHTQSVAALSKTYITIIIGDSGYCGGAHQYFTTDIQTFDLRTGAPVDIGQWIDRAAFARSATKGAIRQELDGVEEDCIDHFDKNQWNGAGFWLSTENVVLTLTTSAPPLLTCNGDNAISFKAFRRVIRPEARPLYDRYVADAKKGVKISRQET